MKIKRFVARDMRQAMREVREEQGPDAVILSTRRLDDGIEVIAAIDYDEALVREAAKHGLPELVALQPPAKPETKASPAPRSVVQQVAARVVRSPAPAPVPAPTPAPTSAPATVPQRAHNAMPTAAKPTTASVTASSAPAATVRPPVAQPPAVHPLVERAARDTAQLRSDFNELRSMLEVQLSSLAWNDMERRQPLRARILRELTRLGIEAGVARTLVDELPEQINADQARYLPLGMLSRNLTVSGRDLCADERSITALVGPTGVGKTTTIAKLAARAVMRHGAPQVALVSTDHYRIGAAAQLEHYGRLLGVQVYPAYDARSLGKVLEMLHGRHTVLIDTAGMAGSDPRLAQQLEILADAGELRSCLVLAANAQVASLEEAVDAYHALKPHACILTKLDEAPRLGGALSVLIRHRLPLDYVTDGQRVPEDIATADARELVCRAARSAKASANPDDDTMAERFGLAMAEA
ncbi:flagellar biosynthesis protein FlhF [Rhodanobacter hydrolyticus]|uniref:Flagellar biosynthesis protein FlhF n=1 Tax=Rhodanobacter hydrolyticus TaxID=2250595 RepID=A0ABW8J8G5_9GAMM